jgi:ribosomal protein S18 acetylase RimI-like enzyme
MSKPTVEVLDITNPSDSVAILALQRAAYAVEAEVIGSAEIPPLHESLQDLTQASLCWIGIRDGGEVVAALAYTTEGNRVDIDRLIVSPGHFRNGLGKTLVESLDPAATITVSTGAANLAARRLYESLEFVQTHDEEVVPGLVVSHFSRGRKT